MPANGRWDLIRHLKVKNECSYTSAPAYTFMECAGTPSPYLNHKFNFLCSRSSALHSPDYYIKLIDSRYNAKKVVQEKSSVCLLVGCAAVFDYQNTDARCCVWSRNTKFQASWHLGVCSRLQQPKENISQHVRSVL